MAQQSDVLIADRVFVGFGSPTSTPEVRELLELRFVSHGTLVVVMSGSPGGIGVVGPGATPAAKAAVRGIAVPAAGDAREVAAIGSTAIRRVSAANGHVLTTPRVSSAKSSNYVLAVAIGGALLGTSITFAAGFLVLRRRR